MSKADAEIRAMVLQRLQAEMAAWLRDDPPVLCAEPAQGLVACQFDPTEDPDAAHWLCWSHMARSAPEPRSIRDVRQERRRQRDRWSVEHDAGHMPADWIRLILRHASAGLFWPDDWNYEKIAAFRAGLVRAAALCLAAIEAMDRHRDTGGGPDRYAEPLGSPGAQ